MKRTNREPLPAEKNEGTPALQRGPSGPFAAAGAMALLLAVSVSAIEYDLSAPGETSHHVPGAFGGTAIFADHFTQPAGTGVFEPFLTIDANGRTSTGSKRIEQGYNTDGFKGLYLDQLRPQWNNLLTLGSLAPVEISGSAYYAFLLDANEPGKNKSLISIENLRIYTSPFDNTANVGDDLSKLNDLGILRWALNQPTEKGGGFNQESWIRLDAAQENVEAGDHPSNGGSGKSDMVAYIPVSAFAGARPDDYVWFYNLNGVQHTAEIHLAAQAGYEEWRAVVAPAHLTLPDGGATAVLLGLGFLGLAAIGRRKS